MPIPSYHACMLPLLKLLSDGKERGITEAVETLMDVFHLTEDERSQTLSSGNTLTIRSRIGWAKTYLKKAGLIDSPARGRLVISQRGLDVLK